MIDWFRYADPFTHTIAVLLLIGRLGDIVSTRLITPTLRLEANAVVRRLGWRFAWLTLLVAFLPYFNLPIGIAVMAASLMVAASNLSRGWIYRAMGEAAAEDWLLQIAGKTRLVTALGFVLGGAAFVISAGAVLMWLSGSSGVPSYWFGVGVALYGVVMAVHGSFFVLRLIRRRRRADQAVTQ
jgi:hypothetical protein